MLKAFLDPLQTEYGEKHNPTKGAGLILNDRNFRGIWAKREAVENKNYQRVEFEYYLTQSLYIDSVLPLTLAEVQTHLRRYWQHKMQFIAAYAAQGDRDAGILPYAFIDNMPGNVFRGERSDMRGTAAVPGYDWKKHEGQVVDGCMTFCRKPSTPEDGKRDSFWWLNKWS